MYGQVNMSIYQTKGTLDYIHYIGGRYMLAFIDYFSWKVWIIILKYKDEVFDWFKKCKAIIKKQTSTKIKHLQTDNGLEFRGGPFNEFCKIKEL